MNTGKKSSALATEIAPSPASVNFIADKRNASKIFLLQSTIQASFSLGDRLVSSSVISAIREKIL